MRKFDKYGYRIILVEIKFANKIERLKNLLGITEISLADGGFVSKGVDGWVDYGIDVKGNMKRYEVYHFCNYRMKNYKGEKKIYNSSLLSL